jgi:hypothetical protein
MRNVRRRGFQQLGGHRLRLLLHLAHGLGHRGAGVGHDPAASRAHAEGNCVVSPACTMTSSKSAPSSSAAIWPWPCAVTPMKT